jgi:thymidine kinase
MYSGKTTELLRRYHRYQIAKKRCLLVKFALDTRYHENLLCTHDQNRIEAVSCSRLSELKSVDYDAIFIDEIQFYPDAVEFSERMANNGIIIHASGLNGTYSRTPFQTISDLIAVADNIDFLTAVCMICRKDTGCYTEKISNDTDNRPIQIGGIDKYIAVCRNCVSDKSIISRTS